MHVGVVLQLRHGAQDHRHDAIPLLNPRESLDPHIQRFVDALTSAWGRYGDLANAPHAEVRRIAEEVRKPWRSGGPEIASVREQTVPTSRGPVRIRLYDPAPDRVKPVLVYLHGGGWTFFSLDTHDRLMREYASRAGVVVAGVDYALSPEAKFPVALEQVVGVARWLGEDRDGGVDATRIAIGGDSAGANLALAACISLRDEGRGDLARAMVLNYGVFDRDSSADARERLGGPGNLLTFDEMESLWTSYLREGEDPYQPLVSPMRADLRRLPAALLIVPEFDLLTEQSLELARRLETARVPVDLKLYRGASHSFLEAVAIAPLADRALTDTAAWLRAHI